MKNLLRLVLVSIFTAFMLTACIVPPGPGGYGVEVAPPLPPVVELGVDPYYYQNGYYYFYQNDSWHYSNARNGPWRELPRSHWPKEIRHRNINERGGEFRHEHEHEHEHEMR
jgi:hypothetical protein